MSIKRLLKMKCNVYRNPILNNPSAMDAYSNVIEPNWDKVFENEQCYVSNKELKSGSSYTMTESGPFKENSYLGFFLTSKEVGDRVEITSPISAFPILYIYGVNPQINARKGTITHYEYLLSIEQI